MSFGTKFVELFVGAIPHLPEYVGYNPERLDFSEKPIQKMLKSRNDLWVDKIQTPEGFRDPEGKVDYRLVAGQTTLATCELKGPVRSTFFTKRSGNYVSEVLTDWGKQCKRQQELPASEHYVGVLAYGGKTEVIQKFQAAPIRSQLPSKLVITFTELLSPTGRQVTLIMMEVPKIVTDLEGMKRMIERANLVYTVEEPTGHWSENNKPVELETAIRLTNRDADLPEDEEDEYSTDLILLFKPDGSFFGFDVG